MPFRLAAGTQIRVSRGWQAGVTEVQAIVDMLINDTQYPREQIREWSITKQIQMGIQQVVYHTYDNLAYDSQGAVETVENDVIQVRHPNLTERYTISQIQNHFRKTAKAEYAKLSDEARRVEQSLLEQEGASDPDYLNWVQYNSDLEASRQQLKADYIALNSGGTYDQWVEFYRTWRQILPPKPELIDMNGGEVYL